MATLEEEINSTTISSGNDGDNSDGDDANSNSNSNIVNGLNVLFDPSQDDYFHLYGVGDGAAAAAVGGNSVGDNEGDANGESGMSNFIVGIWNPNLLLESNQTFSTGSNNSNLIYANTTSWNMSENSDSITTWTSTSLPETSSALDSTSHQEDLFLDTATSVKSTLASASSAVNGPADTAGEQQLFHTVFQTAASADSTADVASAVSTSRSNIGGNYGSEDVNIALIDSVETALDTENDYGEAVGFNGGGDSPSVGDTNEGSLLHQSIAYNGVGGMTKNDSLHQSFDGGGESGIVGINGNGGNNGGSTFMLLFEDFGEYFYNFNNNSSAVSGTTTISNLNNSLLDYRNNCTNLTSTSCYDLTEVDHNYWALILILFPILTLFGNILVILSVCRERSLQTVTNYFIVSLAIADLLVAVVVMPFGVYTLHNDIAVLTLNEPVKFTREIQPICLPTSPAQQGRSYSGQVATVAGWGSLRENGPQPSILQKVQIPIWSNNDCARKYGSAAPGGIIESMLCAGQAARDSCSGDSGGPMIVSEGGRYVQVGIVSWGIGCGKGQYPGVYTRITSLLPWIYKNIK